MGGDKASKPPFFLGRGKNLEFVCCLHQMDDIGIGISALIYLYYRDVKDAFSSYCYLIEHLDR